MIEQGLVMKIQAESGYSTVGGFAGQLPENLPAPVYFYKVISDQANTTLQSFKGFGSRMFQFDCFGAKAVDAQLLANAIDVVLNGFHGTLPDPDSTRVDSIFRTDRMGPEPSSSSRNFWVMLEYKVWYYG